MFRLKIFVTILAFAYASEVAPDQSGTLALPKGDREMQIQAGELLCPLIEDAFDGLVTCECEVPINFPLDSSYADVTCSAPICDPVANVVCADLSFGATLTLGPAAVAASVCIGNIQIFVLTLPVAPLCINYTTVPARGRSIVKRCTANVNGQTCNVCKPCGKTGAVKFDCTNVVEGFKTSTCAQFHPYLGKGSKPAAVVPQI